MTCFQFALNESLSVLVHHIVHQVATNDLFVRHNTSDPDYERMAACINRVAKMLMHHKLNLSDLQFEDISRNWFDVDTFADRGYAVRHLLPRLIQFVPSTVGDDYSTVSRHRIWRVLSRAFVLHADTFKELPHSDMEQLHAFALLPLNTNLETFSEYKSDWKDFAEAIISINGARSSFCQQAIKILEGIRQKTHNDVVACLIELEDANFSNSSPLPVAVLDYVDTLCSSTGAATTIKDLNVVAVALQMYTKRLDGAQLIRMYTRLKDTFASLESTVMSMRCDQSACNEFKNIVANHMRTQKPTQHLVRLLTDEPLKKELSAMQKIDSVVDFVVIPSVWKFNPDRLTDQQRDKMKERRADIPALYNDTSQSQESRSIKPWTPKKLVLQDADAEPMVIEVESSLSASIQPNEEEPITDTPDVPTTVIEIADSEPLPMSQESNSSHGSVALSKMFKDEIRLAKIKNELKKIQVDIVDNEFTVKSRTRNRRSSCNSPVLNKDRANRLKIRETASSLPLSPRTTRTVKGQSVVVLTDTDMSDQHDLDQDDGKKDQKRTPLRNRQLPRRNNTEDNPKIAEKSRKNSHDDVTRSENRALNSDSPKTRRTVRASEISPSSNEGDNSEKRFKRVLPKRSVTPTEPPTAVVETISTTHKNDDKANEANKLTHLNNIDAISAEEKISPTLRSKQADVKEDDLETQMHVDVSTEAIEASQQSPTSSVITGRRSIRRSAKPTTPTTPTQKPNTKTANKSSTTQTMDTLPMDTECAQEVMGIAQAISPPKPTLPIQVRLAEPDTEDQAIAEADTEPNTQITLTDSMLNTSTENHQDARSASPIPHPQAANHEDQNKSILSSPQSNDIEDRNAEFLNDTLNISPIRESASTSKPSTPVRRHQPEDQPTKDAPSIAPSKPDATESPPMVVIAAASTSIPQKCITPLQMRYQAGIIQCSTPNLMSAAPSFSAMSSSVNNSPSTPRYSQLKGRGAQLLNMINSKKKELPKPDISEHPAGPSLPVISEPMESLDTSLPLAPPPRDLLTFSKTLPSPMASPSFSILKRKFIAEPETHEDFESPASKRKRVSFHDPPVSSTKEFIGHADEHPERIIIRPQISAAPAGGANNHCSPADQRMRHILRRKSRADSMVEIAKFGKPKMGALPGLAINNSPPESVTLNNTSIDMEPLKWNDSTSEPSVPKTIISIDELDELIAPTASPLHFQDKTAMLQYVIDEFPLEDVLALYPTNANHARLLTRHLAVTMKQDADVRSATLDQLAENHPLDFLEYAVRSNYSSAVCSKLDPDVMIDHVANLAKNDDAVRSSMLGACAALSENTESQNESLQKLQTTVLDQMCSRAKSTEDTSARTKLMDAVATVLAADQSDTTMTDDQMGLMMQLFNRPMTDNQICECIEMFGRNRKRT